VRLSNTNNRSVLTHLFNRHAKFNRHILAAVAFALLFASVHFVLHDLDEAKSNLIVQDQCQVCRLTHVPPVSTPSLSLIVPLPVIAYFFPVKTLKRHNTLRFPTLGARAPPLS